MSGHRWREYGLALVLTVTTAVFAGCDRQGTPAATGTEQETGAQATATTQPAAERVAKATDEPVPEPALKRARGATDALAGNLMRRLASELGQGGPPNAVRVCSEVAQRIAEDESGAGLTIRRVSLKVRNPKDTPDAYEREKLKEFARLHAKEQLPKESAEVVVANGAKTLRYMRPIQIMGFCLQCHGPVDQLHPEVKDVLAAEYPDDEATGYAAGDLRGAFSVTVDLSEPAAEP